MAFPWWWWSRAGGGGDPLQRVTATNFGNPLCINTRVRPSPSTTLPQTRAFAEFLNQKGSDKIDFGKWPNPFCSTIRETSFKSELSHSSSYSRAVAGWIGEVEDTECFEDLATCESVFRNRLQDFKRYKNIISADFQRAVTLLGRCVRTIFDRIRGENEAVLDFGDPMSAELKSHDVQSFVTSWDDILSVMTEQPSDNKLEAVNRLHLDSSEESRYLIRVYTKNRTNMRVIR